MHRAGRPVRSVRSGRPRLRVDRLGGGGVDGPSAVLPCSLAVPEATAGIVVSISGSASSDASNCSCCAPLAAALAQSSMRPARTAAGARGRCFRRLRRVRAWLWIAPGGVVWLASALLLLACKSPQRELGGGRSAPIRKEVRSGCCAQHLMNSTLSCRSWTSAPRNNSHLDPYKVLRIERPAPGRG